MESVDVLINGVLGLYFSVAFTLGLQLLVDVFGIRVTPITAPMRLVGAGLMSDALAIILGGFLPQMFELPDFVLDLTVFVDLCTTYLLTLAGFSLLQGRMPYARTFIWLAVLMLLPWCLVWVTGNGNQVYSFFSNMVSTVVVAILTVRIWRHDRQLSHRFSNVEQRKFSWYVYFSIWVLLVTPVYHICFYFGIFEGYVRIVCYLMMCVMYIYLTRNVALLNVHKPSPELDKVHGSKMRTFDVVGEDPTQTRAKDIFSSQEQAEMQAHIHRLMVEEKVFKNADLSVDDLSRMMNTNSSYFYYFMRDVLHTNFFDLVNGYRIKAAKEMLMSNEKVEVIAQECGYNSANSFRRVFKKMTDKTPSQWRAEQG